MTSTKLIVQDFASEADALKHLRQCGFQNRMSRFDNSDNHLDWDDIRKDAILYQGAPFGLTEIFRYVRPTYQNGEIVNVRVYRLVELDCTDDPFVHAQFLRGNNWKHTYVAATPSPTPSELAGDA